MVVRKSISSPDLTSPNSLDYEIDFRLGGMGQQFLIAGWSTAEDDYTWTAAQKSIVSFPRIAAGFDFALQFEALPFYREGQIDFQRLFIDLNGQPIARLIYRERAKTEILIPAKAVSDGSMEIVFHMPDARSPAAFGGSSDDRVLGVAMVSLTVQRLPPAARPTQTVIGITDQQMLMQMQSLGENCELAIVQRLHGAEPFGLFRWAATPLPNLLAALAARFEGMGLPEYLDTQLDCGEYQIFDKKFGFRNHSFAFEHTGITKEDVLEREAIRLPFLARRLLKELQRANRLFCFHDAGNSSLEQIELLVDALNNFGPNTLLWVCPAETQRQVGTAEWIHRGLICGYIDRFEPIAQVVTPSHDAWIRMLREAFHLWQTSKSIESLMALLEQ